MKMSNLKKKLIICPQLNMLPSGCFFFNYFLFFFIFYYPLFFFNSSVSSNYNKHYSANESKIKDRSAPKMTGV
jgi:hypothetical protein